MRALMDSRNLKKSVLYLTLKEKIGVQISIAHTRREFTSRHFERSLAAVVMMMMMMMMMMELLRGGDF